MEEILEKIDGRIARGRAMRNRLIKTALKVFAEHGFFRSTTKDVARAANVSPGLMYHYFRSKDELLGAVIDHYRFVDQMRKIIEQNEALDPEEGIRNIAYSLYDYYAGSLDLIRIFLQEGNSNPSVKRAWLKVLEDGVPLLKEYFDRLMMSNRLRLPQTEVTARTLTTTIIMFLFTQSVWPGKSFRSREFIDQFVDILLRGISAA